ncbi:plasmid recombination protein [Hymenobacter sp. BT186]|uniref:Plasmid recombination protein n=1 Tax=Hymenobacter telluris TaxID=2816474 RepID=A0A939F2R7_9BACT|nr:MobV family relaxase [Hymenobacter telluris]MBO0361025.1 plasmid recombination protein [Hymenobacter telluris]MBW3377053.1 plasmid recombination protein [Hymenobacter norwichensis]
MAYAIMRWEKLKTSKQINLATGHNYRQHQVENADKEAPHPNREFIETGGRGYSELIHERIAEAVTRKVKPDAVLGMEVILTGSPEAFRRDKNDRAEDYSNSPWAHDVVDFLKKTFGEKNVVSCNLHQDEKTPHFHAIIVPITPDGRLSAKDLFNPVTLRGYQTAYAEAMEVHGMERGVKNSKAQRKDMKSMYGQQVQTGQEAGQAIVGLNSGPVVYKPITVETPGRVQLDPAKWAQEQSQRVNEEARPQVEAANQRTEAAEKAREAANQRAEEVLKQAQENAAAKGQVRGLQKQLHTSEALKQAHADRAESLEAKFDILAKQLAGGEPAPSDLVERGNKLLDQDMQQVKASREQLVKLGEESDQAEKKGDYGRVATLRYDVIPKQAAQNEELENRLRAFAGGAERLAQLDAEQARQTAEKARQAAAQEEQARQIAAQAEQARLARIVEQQALAEQARLAEQQAQEERTRAAAQQAADKIQQEVLERETKANNQERERRRVEQVVEQLLSQNPNIYQVHHFIEAVKRKGISVQYPKEGELIFQLAGSEHKFSSLEIKPNNQEFRVLLNKQMKANNQRWQIEQDRPRSNDREM